MERAKFMTKRIWQALNEKKGEDIKVIDISQVSVIADYFVIATGSSANQVNALVENVEEKLESEGITVKHREGYGLGNWVLLDFGEVIVHIFDKENRLFYDLERIWRDGKVIEIDEI